MMSKRDLLDFMKGWYAGAACQAIDPDLSENPHYKIGYDMGRSAQKAAQKQAEMVYGIKFGIVEAKDK